MIVGIASKLVSGSYILTTPHALGSVSVERYTLPDNSDGFMFIVNTATNKLTNYLLYSSVIEALTASDKVTQ